MHQLSTSETPGSGLVAYCVHRRKFYRRMMRFCAGDISAGRAIPLVAYHLTGLQATRTLGGSTTCQSAVPMKAIVIPIETVTTGISVTRNP